MPIVLYEKPRDVKLLNFVGKHNAYKHYENLKQYLHESKAGDQRFTNKVSMVLPYSDLPNYLKEKGFEQEEIERFREALTQNRRNSVTKAVRVSRACPFICVTFVVPDTLCLCLGGR